LQLADGRLQQGLRADDVRHHEVGRAHDRAVDVRLGCEVHDQVHPGHDLRDRVRIADVTLYEPQSRVVLHRREVGIVAGVGQLVEHHDLGFGE
jgi:hypothetical protein